jgi:MFS family permease
MPQPMPAPDTRADALAWNGATARFILVCIGVWLHSADTLVTATIAPAIVENLGGIAYINWTISIYEVGAIIAGSAAGMLCQRWSIKKVFIGATVLYGVGCAAGACAPTMAILVSARLLQGMGGGLLLTLCYVAVQAWFAPKLWGRLFAIVALIWGGGSLLGPLIGAAFAGPHTWRGAFWAFSGQAAILWALAAAALPQGATSPDANSPGTVAHSRLATQSNHSAAGNANSTQNDAQGPSTEPHDDKRHKDKRDRGQWPVVPLIVLSSATLIIAESGATSTPDTGHAALSILGCLAGLVLLYVAVRLDRRSPVRLLPEQSLDLRHPVGAGLMMVFALSAGTTGFWAYGPLLLKILFGTKPLVTGYILAGEAIAWSLATMAVARATPAADRWIIRGGAVAVTVGAAGFAVAVPSGSLAALVGCGLLQGAGFGLCWPAIVQRVVRFASPQEQSLASASVSTVQRIGYAVGTAAVGIAANMSGLAEGVSATAAKTAGFWVFAAFIPVLVIAVVSAWAFTRHAPTERRTPNESNAAQPLDSIVP